MALPLPVQLQAAKKHDYRVYFPSEQKGGATHAGLLGIEVELSVLLKAKETFLLTLQVH